MSCNLTTRIKATMCFYKSNLFLDHRIQKLIAESMCQDFSTNNLDEQKYFPEKIITATAMVLGPSELARRGV